VRYPYALFDFDGTIADTKEGIIAAADHALRTYGIEADRETLLRFVGPTLWDSFKNLFGFDQKKADEAVSRYREYYSVKGIYQASLYPGTKEMLETLRTEGVKMGIGSSKNEIYVLRALEHFGVRDYFDVIIGSTPEGGHSSKEELIGMLMESFGDASKEKYIYAGDSHTDLTGAAGRGVDFIAALYDRDESEFAGLSPTYAARSVEEMGRIILGGSNE